MTKIITEEIASANPSFLTAHLDICAFNPDARVDPNSSFGWFVRKQKTNETASVKKEGLYM